MQAYKLPQHVCYISSEAMSRPRGDRQEMGGCKAKSHALDLDAPAFVSTESAPGQA